MEKEIQQKAQDLADALIVELKLKQQEQDIKVQLISAHKQTLYAKEELKALELKIYDTEKDSIKPVEK